MITKKDLDQFLDKVEQDKLSQFADDEKMKEAVRKILLFGIYNSGVLRKGIPHDPTKNFALTIACVKGSKNEDIGKDVKACWEGINEMGLAFKKIDMYKTVKPTPPKENPAR